MADIQVGRTDFRRGVTKAASIVLKNRWFEQNPVLNASEEFTSLIARPRLKKFLEAGSGHIRKTFNEPGTFDDDLFVVSGEYLYRVDRIDAVASTIGQIGSNPFAGVSMAATGAIGTVPAYLFVADGGVLWLYLENGAARGVLQATGAIADGDTVEIGGVYYEFTSGSVDAGTPDGSLANPWLVAFAGVNATDMGSLFAAINGTGTPGTTYSTDLVAHATVVGSQVNSSDLYVSAKATGTDGNTITTTETGANLAWGAATLEDGGTEQLRQVAMPDDIGAISIAHLNSYIIIVPAQGHDVNGRFYWIEPGETYVDPLNFATAERSPDAGNQVIVFSDRFWIGGQTTTEAWVFTGVIASPVQRFSGVLYDRGVWAGTAVKVKDSMILVDENGGVFQIGGGITRISRPDIEERIRKAISAQAFANTLAP